jgi:mannose-6-phosphate isomerase-like protein (cupin superfamily)
MTTRRVVTAIDEQGKSYFKHDGPTPGRVELGLFIDDEIWIDDPARPDPAGEHDPATAERFQLEPPAGGSCIRIFTFLADTIPPETTETSDSEVLAAARFDTGDAMEADNPGMHTTATIDYGIVLSGNITLELDQGEVDLGPGDVVVQRATRHAWRNRSGQPCRVAFVLIGSPNYEAGQ